MKKLLMLIGALIMSNAYGEGVYWMVDNAVSSVSSCNTGGNITKPSNPTKSGYRFMGWGTGSPSTLAAKDFSCSYPANNATSFSCTYTGGSLTITAKCSDTVGSVMWSNQQTTTSGAISDTSGKYCWCRISTFNNVTINGPWVYRTNGSTVSECTKDCAKSCCGGGTTGSGGFDNPGTNNWFRAKFFGG